MFNHNHGAQPIDVQHMSLMALHFPLLIPSGPNGYRPRIPQVALEQIQQEIMCQCVSFMHFNYNIVTPFILQSFKVVGYSNSMWCMFIVAY